MATNRTKRTRKRRGDFTPLQLAILTGAPLPADVHPFEAYRVTHPEEIGLLATHSRTFVEIWREYHGRPITAEELAAVKARAPEIDAAVAATRARRNGRREIPAAAGPAASNWPAAATENFQPVARIEGDE